MQPIKRLVLASCLVSAAGVAGACRGQLPPTQPPRGAEDTPATRTDDGLAAAPLAGTASPGVATTSGGGSGVALPMTSAGSRSQ